jgi:hypothetical protein
MIPQGMASLGITWDICRGIPWWIPSRAPKGMARGIPLGRFRVDPWIDPGLSQPSYWRDSSHILFCYFYAVRALPGGAADCWGYLGMSFALVADVCLRGRFAVTDNIS